MTILPVPQIPRMQQRYLNSVPPAGLVVLEKPHRVLPPAGMGQLYVEGGALKYRGSSGTVTTIANA